MPDNEAPRSEWLTIREASALLSISPSTLRRWADNQTVPGRTTAGGHRRFRRDVIEGLVRSAPSGVAVAEYSKSVPAKSSDWSAQYEQLRNKDWHGKFENIDSISSMRALGQRLLGLLLQTISRRDDDQRLLDEAREVGKIQGQTSAKMGATLPEVIDAFLFFKNSVGDLVLQFPQPARSSDGEETIRLAQKADQFMSVVLSGIAEGYESANAG